LGRLSHHPPATCLAGLDGFRYGACVVHPIIFSVGPITIYSFGVMLAIAFLAAGNVVQRELARKGLDPELASSFVLWAAVGGLVGSRLLSLVDDWQAFLAHPLAFIFTGAGFVFYGGLLGGFLTVSVVIYRRGLPWRRVTDCIAPGLAIGQAIGRIGCQLAGDGDWGTPSTLPWAMSYPNAIIGWESWTRASGLPPDVRVHPAPIYETIGYGLVFLILWSTRRGRRPDGFALWLYLVLSAAVRFLVEFVRINPRVALGLTEAQLISLALIALGALLLWRSTGGAALASAGRMNAVEPPTR
jgi:phosphatidylglycerol---prolipoprotein diacylglyceryl transferase